MAKASLLSHLKLNRVKGQAAGIRFFDETSKEDFAALREIMAQKEVKKWMDDSGKISWSDYQEWAGKHNGQSFLFAVHDIRQITAKEIEKIRGFVSIYSERSEKFRLKRLVKMGVFDESYLKGKFLEISVAGDGTGSGLISSGLRQACLQVRYILKDLDENDLKIVAFIDPENKPSVRVIEASGFEKIGSAKYDSDSDGESEVFVLNWQKLGEKINRSASGKVIMEPQMTDSHCGPAITKALLNFQGIEVSQDQIIEAARVKQRLEVHGMRPDQINVSIKKLAPKLTLWFKQDSTFKDLDHLINKLHLPVGINWQGLFYDTVEEEKIKSPKDDHGHYSIVIGVKNESKQLLIDDPYADYFHCPRVVPYKWFLKRWWDEDIVGEDKLLTRRLLFVVVPGDYVFPEKLGMKKY